jgi:ElaB/YqjD/DUF883 family membrane-anchored ribosome-binding protein
MARRKNGNDTARNRLAALRAELERLESEGADMGEEALSRSSDLTKRALSVADEIVEDAAVETLDVAETVVSGAADGMDEARASIRATPVASILIALGIGVVLGHFTAGQPSQAKSWL